MDGQWNPSARAPWPGFCLPSCSRWFRWHCERDGVEPRARFRELLREHATGVLHKPFNTEARLEAGFDLEELEALLAEAG